MVKYSACFLLLFMCMISCSTDSSKQNGAKNLVTRKKINSQSLVQQIFEKELDSLITEGRDRIIVIAQTKNLEINKITMSENKCNYLLYADTISFNKLLNDNKTKKVLLPVFVEFKILQNSYILTFVLFDSIFL